ncbi:MAG: hypothetical protein IPJ40_07940 [Saprospirales bacterium]|nr:hypothetical protein [Saprospirales bacterium]
MDSSRRRTPAQVARGVLVTNVNTTTTYCSIQEAIDDPETLNNHKLAIKTGTYAGNVDLSTKTLTLAPGSSPGCVTITGDMTLNSGDVLEMEIDGTTPCTEHDQFIVSGTVTLGGASLSLPAGAYFAQPGDQIVLIDGSNPIVGQFAEGNFATDGTNNYYINYAGGDGNDVVLTKCCSGLLDIGIFNYAAASPAGNKLQVFVKPNMDVINGLYTAGIFTIRTLSSNGVTFTKLSSPIPGTGYSQAGFGSDGGYDYFVFNYENGNPGPINWMKNTEYELITLGYDCIGDATFELIDDAFTASVPMGGSFYQELGAQEAQGSFYQSSATSPTAVSITATSSQPGLSDDGYRPELDDLGRIHCVFLCVGRPGFLFVHTG